MRAGLIEGVGSAYLQQLSLWSCVKIYGWFAASLVMR